MVTTDDNPSLQLTRVHLLTHAEYALATSVYELATWQMLVCRSRVTAMPLTLYKSV
jgi:hypothetical protein